MDRLRNRDLRTNNNKCYAMYFDDDQNKDITNKTMPAKKPKTRSPRKKEPTKNYPTDAATESAGLNTAELHATAEPRPNDAVAVSTMNAIESSDGGMKISKPTVGAGTMHGDMARMAQCNGSDGNRNDGVKSTTDSQRMNNGTMVDGSTAPISEPMDNKPSDAGIRAKGDDPPIDSGGAGEMERNDRKRRLSQSHDRTAELHNDDDEDDDDDDAESCETDGLNYATGKKAKIECSRARMFQVGQMLRLMQKTRCFRLTFPNGTSDVLIIAMRVGRCCMISMNFGILDEGFTNILWIYLKISSFHINSDFLYFS